VWLPGALASGTLESADAEAVAGHIKAENDFIWPYGYDISWDGHVVLVRVAVKLIPHGGVNSLDLDRVKGPWEACIEEVWSRRYALKTGDGRQYPIVVDVTFNGPRYHHQVIVRPKGGRSDSLNWNLMNSPAMAAHEFGHLLGVFDEYWPGATDPDGRIIDATSIMTSHTSGGKTYGRHYRRIAAWFAGKSGSKGVEPVAIDGDPRPTADRYEACIKKE
jgi:hypothetical protein